MILWFMAAFSCINMVERVNICIYAPFLSVNPEYNQFFKIISVFNLPLNAVMAVVLTHL
jgi:hypothetical protein